MTGPDHLREAESLLLNGCDYGCPHAGCAHEASYIARAQVHMTAALAAAVIASGISVMKPTELGEWRRAMDPDYAAEVAS